MAKIREIRESSFPRKFLTLKYTNLQILDVPKYMVTIS